MTYNWGMELCSGLGKEGTLEGTNITVPYNPSYTKGGQVDPPTVFP